MEHSLHHKVSIINAATHGTNATGIDGTVIDSAGFESLEYVIQVGTILGTASLAVVLEESDEVTFGGEETAVSADDTLGALPTIGASQASGSVLRVGTIGKKRYQRITIVGTVSTGTYGAIGILGHPKNAATAEQDS